MEKFLIIFSENNLFLDLLKVTTNQRKVALLNAFSAFFKLFYGSCLTPKSWSDSWIVESIPIYLKYRGLAEVSICIRYFILFLIKKSKLRLLDYLFTLQQVSIISKNDKGIINIYCHEIYLLFLSFNHSLSINYVHFTLFVLIFFFK